MALPFAPKRLIVKSLDEPEAGRTGDPDDIFPLLVSLQDFCGKALNPSCNSPMLVDLPHTLNILHYIEYVNLGFDNTLAA